MKKYIESIKLINKKGIYTIKGNVNKETLVDIQEISILGYGMEGYIVAAYVAAIYKKNVGFVRDDKKKHGTCRRIDGNYDINNDVVLFVSSTKMRVAQEFMQEEGINCKDIYYFDIIDSESLNLESLELNNAPEYYQSDIKQHTVKLTGMDFVLSSGAKSKVYYETLTAANTYTLLNDMIRDNENTIISNDVMIGVGYGGVYFGLLASLINNKPFIAIDVNCNLEELNIDKVLLLDDCTSTGSTIYKLCDSLKLDINNISVLSLYVKRRAFLMVPNIKECAILL